MVDLPEPPVEKENVQNCQLLAESREDLVTQAKVAMIEELVNVQKEYKGERPVQQAFNYLREDSQEKDNVQKSQGRLTALVSQLDLKDRDQRDLIIWALTTGAKRRRENEQGSSNDTVADEDEDSQEFMRKILEKVRTTKGKGGAEKNKKKFAAIERDITMNKAN